jgi:non-heme chloroperoxidase
MVQTDTNPGGLPKAVFDDLQVQLAANRSEFYRGLASGPFYGFNRPGVQPSEAIIQNWWRQGGSGRSRAAKAGGNAAISPVTDLVTRSNGWWAISRRK